MRRSPGERPVPGWRSEPRQQAELERIWHAVDDDGRKMLLYLARQLAKEHGLVPPDTPLVVTDRVL